jgi:phosphatidylcholine synthase
VTEAGRQGPPGDRRLSVAAAWLVHLYTASTAVLAFLATRAIFEYRFRDAFFWLAAAIVIDATDGVLARAARVSERLPGFNGAKLDDIVDYLTYVFVPAVFVWRSLLVPDAWAMPVVAAMLLSSAYGFNRDDAKTNDHFFTGFPSYWNIVVLYLFLMQLTQRANTIVLMALAALVFVPVRYLYPTRTPTLRGLTIALGTGWGVLMLVMIWQLPVVSPLFLWGSLVFPVYYVILSFTIGRAVADPTLRQAQGRPKPRRAAKGPRRT